MSSQNNKPRLSDITKKSATDRASKLAGAFLPPPPTPVAAPDIPESAPVTDIPSNSGVEIPSSSVTEIPPSPGLEVPTAPGVAVPPTPSSKPKERVRRSTGSMDLTEMVNNAVPEGLRCTRMIMLCDEHHDLLRELAFKFKKPMTAILYNLLEPAYQANEREKQKGETNNV